MLKCMNCLLTFMTSVLITFNCENLHLSEAKKFKIYWNVPTFMCHRHGMKFEEVSEVYDITQNSNDTFTGNEIAILYHAGEFPTYIKFENNTEVKINGQVPQKGDLQKHLRQLEIDLKGNVTDPNFSGIGVLDYERWRPVFRQNFNNVNRIYKEYSINLEKTHFNILNEKQARALAEKAYNYSARLFYEETIKLVRKHRPKAAWAFYDYPVCYNLTPRSPHSQCDGLVKAENDRMAWLWDQSGVLLPSVYAAKAFTKENLTEYINGRLVETYRIANKYYPPKKIFPFLRYRYRDSMDEFVTQDDYIAVFRELLRQNVDGLVIWGSSNDVNTQQKCINLLNHLHDVLGPLLKSIDQFYPQNTNPE